MIILSLGAGVQSTALLVLSNNEERMVPRADVCIFADMGDEPGYVYQHLERLKEWSEIPIEVVSKGVLSDDILAGRNDCGRARFVSVPAFTVTPDGTEGLLRRECTREYKIDPIANAVKKLLGYTNPRTRVKERVHMMIGISRDEVHRMKPNKRNWIRNVWPLVDAGLRYADCVKISQDHGVEAPGKSACVYCPFHSDAYWRDLRDNNPQDFERAVRFDNEIRNMSRAGEERPIFIHRSLRPLGEAEFTDEHQLDLFNNECDGICGT